MLKKPFRRLVLGALLVLAASGCSGETDNSAGPLVLLRFGPEGQVPRLTQIAAMFNQPMVPLGAYDQVPEGVLKLTPDLPGRRIWLNQYTLAFVPDRPLEGSYKIKAELRADRLPAALSGARLEKDAAAEIRLPLLGVQSRQLLNEGDKETALTPAWRVVFNQPPDTAGLENRAYFTWSEGWRDRKLAARVAPQVLPGSDNSARYFEFAAPEPLPKDTPYRLVLQAGAVSLAGPEPAPELILAEGRTYGPLTISWADPDDPDLAAWPPQLGPPTLAFSNPVDLAGIAPLLRLTPEYDHEALVREYEESEEGEEAGRIQRRLYLYGQLKGETDYTLTLDPAARDIHGQPLASAKPLTFRTKAYQPAVEFGLDEPYGLLETSAPPQLRLTVTNLPKVDIEG
ncbi:MAG: hypothetical protein LBV70_07130, partial [Candidatus Adiutrix sp.]|nr:hypothetical protein [Candidatus Adiutrix sp.]